MRYSGFASLLLLLLAGCATAPVENKISVAREPDATPEKFTPPPCPSLSNQPLRRTRAIDDHIVRVSPDGLMVDPEQAGQPLDQTQAQRAFQHMLCEATRLAEHHGSDRPRLLIYVHGGLNSYQHSDQKIHDGLAWQVMNDSQDWHYPIFISWKSDALSNWGEHILRLREGKKAGAVIGAASAPFILIADIATTLGRFPATVYYQLSNEKDRAASRGLLMPPRALSGSWKTANNNFCGENACANPGTLRYQGKQSGLTANLSRYKTSFTNSAGRGGAQIVTFPLRYTVGSLWHSAVSASAWDVMKRRTQTQFFPASDFDGRWQPENLKPVPGGHLFTMLLAHAQARPDAQPDLTLVGHSMGTLVINRALERFQDQWTATDLIDDVVYMAAAASIEDSLNALAPVLADTPRPGEAPVNFYNLTLNRVAEVSEMHYGGVIPTGSLLVSIDQHHERPEHALRRTFGSEVNVLSSIQIVDQALRHSDGELVFKAFDRQVGAAPSSHGDFGTIPFWRQETWRLGQEP